MYYRFPLFFVARPICWLPPARRAAPSTSRRASSSRPGISSHPVEKVRSTGNDRISLTERGASFGYNTLVVDYRSLPVMRQIAPVIFDGTHSVQQPSAAGGVSGGQPEFIPLLARAAVAAGIDGLFLEVHDDPANAKSDGANALDLRLLKPLLEKLLAIHAAAI